MNGRPLDCADNYKGWMKHAGFKEVEKTVFFWPQNGWAKAPNKQIGLMNQKHFSMWLEGLCMALFTKFLGWTEEEVRRYCLVVRCEISNPKIHAYFRV